MWSSAGPDDAPDTAPDQHARPRHVAPLRTANDRTARLGLERPPTTAEFHINPLIADEQLGDRDRAQPPVAHRFEDHADGRDAGLPRRRNQTAEIAVLFSA